MSAQGRVTGQMMRSYCQVQQETIPCRLIDGDLQWISYTFFGFFIVLGIGSFVFNEAQKALKNGTFKRLLSFTRFWKWFCKKENLALVSGMAVIPTIAFIGTPLAMPLVWIVSVFVIYLYKNWKEESKQ
jgi:hypothetical protein